MAQTQAALGNAVDYAIAPQLENEVPGTDFRSLIVNLPLESGSPVRSEASDGSVNASGFMTPLIPSTITGAVSVPLRFLTGDVLEFVFNLFRKVTKTSLQSGAAFQYEYAPDINGPDWALTTYTGINPVQRFFVHGFKVGAITIPLGTGDATTLVATVTGFAQQAQSFGLREPDGGNTGTLNEIFVRGPIRYPDLGDLYIQIVDASASPATYLAEITDVAPIFPGVPVPLFLDLSISPTPRAGWQDLGGAVKFEGTVTVAAGTGTVAGEFVGVGTKFLKRYQVGNLILANGETATIASVEDNLNLTLIAVHVAGAAGDTHHGINRDLGFHNANVDPLQWILQGTDAEHAAGVVDLDFWKFPKIVPALPQVFNPEGNGGALTGAHTIMEWREVGEILESDYRKSIGTDVELVISWPLEEERGTGSRYATGIDRTGQFGAVLNFSSVFRDANTFFIQAAEAHERFQVRITIESDKLGDGLIRNGHVITLNNVGITETHPVSDPGRVIISSVQTGTTDDTGSVVPVEWNIICLRNWPVPIFI